MNEYGSLIYASGFGKNPLSKATETVGLALVSIVAKLHGAAAPNLIRPVAIDATVLGFHRNREGRIRL